MDVSKLLVAWPLAGPCEVSSLSGGTNSLVWRVGAADGQSYVLRITPDSASLPRLRYEAALLHALAEKGLPFLLPLPLRANSGESIVPFEQENGASALVTLQPFLPGSHPEREDLSSAAEAAISLAALDAALAALPELPVPDGSQSLTTPGDLAHWHVLVPDPLAAVEQLPIDRAQSRQIQSILSTVMGRVSDLYKRLPQQLLHRDYCPSNVLMDDHHVTAVLDFEFANMNLRILELAVALSWWPVNLMGTGREWSLIDAFGSAYVAHFPLSEEELLALPDALRLRDATSLVHRIGRYLAGLETDARMVDRVKHSLWREEWLLANQGTLLQHVLAWI